MIDRKDYMAQRLAWKYVHGTDPKGYIDHINQMRDDNRIANLRDVDHDENIANVLSGTQVLHTLPMGKLSRYHGHRASIVPARAGR
jgi:hypothetical protein